VGVVGQVRMGEWSARQKKQTYLLRVQPSQHPLQRLHRRGCLPPCIVEREREAGFGGVNVVRVQCVHGKRAITTLLLISDAGDQGKVHAPTTDA